MKLIPSPGLPAGDVRMIFTIPFTFNLGRGDLIKITVDWPPFFNKIASIIIINNTVRTPSMNNEYPYWKDDLNHPTVIICNFITLTTGFEMYPSRNGPFFNWCCRVIEQWFSKNCHQHAMKLIPNAVLISLVVWRCMLYDPTGVIRLMKPVWTSTFPQES